MPGSDPDNEQIDRETDGAAPLSRTDIEWFTDDRSLSGRLLRQLSIGFQDHHDGFLEIRARFLQLAP